MTVYWAIAEKRDSIRVSLVCPYPAGPCTQIVYILALKLSLYRYFEAKSIYFFGHMDHLGLYYSTQGFTDPLAYAIRDA